jgi:glutamyl-tRNA synthetase
LTDLYLSILAKKGIDKNKDFVLKVVSLIKERAVFVKDFWELSSFFFETPLEFEAKAAKKNWKEDTSELMTLFIPVISNIEDFSSENIEKEIKEWITSKEIGFGKIMQPLRLSLVGKLAGPHLFDIIAMIGKQETISRIENAIGKL